MSHKPRTSGTLHQKHDHEVLKMNGPGQDDGTNVQDQNAYHADLTGQEVSFVPAPGLGLWDGSAPNPKYGLNRIKKTGSKYVQPEQNPGIHIFSSKD